MIRVEVKLELLRWVCKRASIVAELEAKRKLVEANRDLIARMNAKIKAKPAEVWGETRGTKNSVK